MLKKRKLWNEGNRLSSPHPKPVHWLEYCGSQYMSSYATKATQCSQIATTPIDYVTYATWRRRRARLVYKAWMVCGDYVGGGPGICVVYTYCNHAFFPVRGRRERWDAGPEWEHRTTNGAMVPFCTGLGMGTVRLFSGVVSLLARLLESPVLLRPSWSWTCQWLDHVGCGLHVRGDFLVPA